VGQIPLRYNPLKRQYVVTVGLALGAPGHSPNATLGGWIQEEFIFDSGSNRTAITEGLAQKLGANVESLPLVDVGGVTGLARRPFLAEVDLWFLGDEFRGVRVPGVTVLRTLREKKIGRSAGLKRQTLLRLPAPCLLGTDAIEALRARVVLDFKNRVGLIEG